VRAVIFGAGGMLGQALAAGLPGAGYTLAGALGRKECDIGDAAMVRGRLEALGPDVVFNPAAYTNVDGAEDHPDEAHRANAVGPENVARACAALGARMVHYSTDFVFDGERETPYDEDAAPSPQSVYARTKLEGDRRVLAACPQAYVLRVGCLYGQGGRNFPSTILRRLRAGEPVRADGDRLASPTWVVPVVAVSAALARTGAYGLFHATSDGATTWADFARFIARGAGLPEDRVQAVPYGDLPLKAARPRRAILENRRLKSLDLDTLGDWQTQARAYLATEG
jgi:dTDP-4-dehydrorhamnose reductase